jgi:hypothetical protein
MAYKMSSSEWKTNEVEIEESDDIVMHVWEVDESYVLLVLTPKVREGISIGINLTKYETMYMMDDPI